MSGAGHRIVIGKDLPPETRLPVGLPVNASDKDNIGAVLAKDAGTLKAGTLLTPDHIEQLKDQDIKDILIHSPLTEPSDDGSISKLAAGKRFKEGLHEIGDNVGLPASQSIGERLSQGLLQAKHKSGVDEKRTGSGYAYIEHTRILR